MVLFYKGWIFVFLEWCASLIGNVIEKIYFLILLLSPLGKEVAIYLIEFWKLCFVLTYEISSFLFSYFVISLLHWNKVEIHLPKDALCYVWLKLAQWFWRKRFSESCQFIFTIFQLSPLGKGYDRSFEETAPKNELFPVWFKLAQWLWRIRWCDKFTDRRSIDQKSILALSDHISLILNRNIIKIVHWR